MVGKELMRTHMYIHTSTHAHTRVTSKKQHNSIRVGGTESSTIPLGWVGQEATRTVWFHVCVKLTVSHCLGYFLR